MTNDPYQTALTHNRYGRSREAIACLEMCPDRVMALRAMAVAYSNLGEFDQAEQCFRKAISLNPQEVYSWAGLAYLRKFTSDDTLHHDLEALLKRPLSDWGRQYVHFALGKIYDDLGEVDLAFRNYSTGNQIGYRDFNFHPYEKHLRELEALWNRQMEADVKGFGLGWDGLVFVVGMPRSGTTLVSRIISSGFSVADLGEYTKIHELNRELGKLAGREEIALRNILIKPDAISGLARKYVDDVAKHWGSREHAVNKTPNNFVFIPFIKALFPKAKIVHCVRDPLDTGLSCFFQNMENAQEWCYSLENIGRYHNLYRQIMSHHDVFTVRYEDVIADFDGQKKRIFDYLELEGSGDFTSGGSVNTASQWQVRQPLYSSSVGKWKRYEEYILPLIEIVGSE